MTINSFHIEILSCSATSIESEAEGVSASLLVIWS